MADVDLPFSIISCPVATKRCKRCRKTKPLTDFHFRRDQNRHRADCKECYLSLRTAKRDPEDNRRRVKKWQKANPEKRNAQSRRYHENSRSDLTRWIAGNLKSTRVYCKKKGLPCVITAVDVVEKFNAQNGRCALTGRELIWGSKGHQRDSLSIDRIDPSKGYVLDNVRLVTYQANMARGQFSDEELVEFCEAVLSKNHSAAGARPGGLCANS